MTSQPSSSSASRQDDAEHGASGSHHLRARLPIQDECRTDSVQSLPHCAVRLLQPRRGVEGCFDVEGGNATSDAQRSQRIDLRLHAAQLASEGCQRGREKVLEETQSWTGKQRD
eukprot:542790-Rhodomonas_salina.1